MMGKLSEEIRRQERETYVKEWKRENPEKVREANKRYREKKRKGVLVMKPGPLWEEARSRARENGEEWEVLVIDVEVGETCAVTGMKLGGKGSLEKKRKEGRWEKSNVWVVGEKAAAVLRVWEARELRELVEKVSER